jgi:uracil-DNA glycosylase
MSGRAGLAAQFERLSAAWRSLLAPFLASPGCAHLIRFVDAEVAAGKTVYPETVFHALELVEPAEVKVVILGQDPYHGPGQAHGLAFSVPAGARIPPSLRNIFTELQQDVGCVPPGNGNLESWARQGVLLLNTVLTVEGGQPQSHAKRGWEAMTDVLIAGLARDPAPKVFMLWGAPAQAKRALIGEGHLVLAANHPSPLSARRPPVPFIGCRHFSRANQWLQQAGRPPIDWELKS